MVATGSPEATEVAVGILEGGGNAIDAAVAAALTLGVVDFDASGIGGATSMVIRLASGRVLAVDGTSRAPMVIDIDRFREFKKSGLTYGYETVAVPTTLAALEHVQSRYGSMDMSALFEPAIEFAERGYSLSKIQIRWTHSYYDVIRKSSQYLSLLAMEDGRTIGIHGDRNCRPDLANTYRRLVAKGVQDFYRGRIADEIEADMIRGGGFLRKSDLVALRIREMPPLHTTYRGFDVYTLPPPGGGAVVIATLHILESYPSDFLAENSAERHHTLIEAFRIAAVDAAMSADQLGRPGADPLSRAHAQERATLIVPGKAIPEAILASPLDPACQPQGESTTHVSVADNLGNVVSLTQTLSRSFGAKVATPGLGFPYNSFLEYFNADKPMCPGFLQPNSPCVTDMAPTIVLAEGRLFAALGSPGSNKTQPVVSQVISNMVDRGLGIRDAVNAPRVLWGGLRWIRAWFELADPITNEEVQAVGQMGFERMTVLPFPVPDEPEDTILTNFGGVNAVGWDADTKTFVGVGDKRRWGSARGPRAVAVNE
jgi:gamma-glutamyltranspeptidase/glutathione hydrolase